MEDAFCPTTSHSQKAQDTKVCSFCISAFGAEAIGWITFALQKHSVPCSRIFQLILSTWQIERQISCCRSIVRCSAKAVPLDHERASGIPPSRSHKSRSKWLGAVQELFQNVPCRCLKYWFAAFRRNVRMKSGDLAEKQREMMPLGPRILKPRLFYL